LAHHESAKKRMRQDARRKAVNRAVKSEIKSVTKRVAGAAAAEEADMALREAASVIDKAAKKRIIHWKTAARKKSRMARRTKSRTA
jgi:small subunit ribosomal protein S20